MNKVLIDRKELCDAIEKQLCFPDSTKAAMRAVAYQVPAVDAVEVVRCKDCRYLTRLAIGGYGYTLHCGYRGHLTYENDYCAAGRRRASNG